MTDYEDDSPEEQSTEEGAAVPGIEESDAEVLAMVKKARKDSDKHLKDWLDEAKEMFDLVAGEQWSESDKAKLEEMGRVPVVFNRIAPVIDSVCGSEVNNRQQVKYIPRTVGDSGVNEVLTGAAAWVRDQCDAEDEESDAFFDAIVCGMGWTETHLENSEDPEGKILIERRDPKCMRYDPAAKKRNLADKKWVQYSEYLCKEEIEEKWPDAELGTPGAEEYSNEDTKQHNADQAWKYKDNASGYDANSGKYLVIHHEWFTMEDFYRLVDPGTQQVVDMPEDRFQAVQDKLKQLGFPLQSVKLQKKVYKQAFVCGQVVLEKSLLPVQKSGFTFKAITGKRDRNTNTWFGLVRPMADPQRWANKFFSQILHIINTNAKGGLMIEEGATDNLRELEEKWSAADSVVTFNDGALTQGKVQPKPQPPYPTTPEKMMEFSVSSIRDVSGVNLELLGLAERDQPGVVESQRKQAGLVILATFFDALRRYRKMQGRTLAEFIQNYLSDGRLVRIVGGDGTEKFVPLLKQPGVMEYDVVVDESPTSHNVKERVFLMLMNILPAMQKLGLPPPPPEMIDYLPIPSTFAEKWKQSLVQAMQQPKQDPRVALEMQKTQAQIALKREENAQKMQLERDRAQMQAQVDINRQQAENEQQAANDARDAVADWRKALLDAATKIEVANINSKAKLNDAATQDATSRVSKEL